MIMRLIRVLLYVCLASLLPDILHAATPGAPQNVQPAWIYGGPVNCARVTWDPVEGADSYNAYRFNDATASWDPIATGITNLMNFDFEAFSAPKSYVVTAVNGDGESSASGIATVADGDVFYFLHRSPSQFPEPDQRYGWVTPTSARIIWLLQSTGGADGMLEFGDSTTNLQTVYFQPAYQMFGHGVTLTNLTPSTLYYYRITSVTPNRVGSSELYFLQTSAPNQPPIATFQFLTPFEDTELPLTLSGEDLDGDPLSYTITAGPSYGILTGTPPSLSYIPSNNFFGPDSFTFKVNDGETDSTEATVTLHVAPVNDVPIIAPDRTVTLNEDSFIEITNLAFDVDGDSLMFILVDPPSHGFVSSFGTSLYYFADPDFSGTDSFSVAFNDWQLTSPAMTITTIVAPVNDAPTATNQILEIDEDTTVTAPALAADVDGDPLTFVIAIAPQHGTVVVTGSNFVYTPSLNYYGWDNFVYQPTDGVATGNVAAVDFHIRPVNDAPAATNRFLVTAEETPVSTMLDLVAEPDWDPVSIIIVDAPTHGTLSPNYLYYTPELNFTGTDSFTFRYNDGLMDGNVATVTIDVTPVNDLPIAADLFLTTAEDTPIGVTLAGTDVDGELTYIIVTDPWRGTLTGSGANRTYVPRLNLNGTDSFTYKVSDGQTESAPATVTISVTPVNDPPIPMIGLILGWEDTAQPVLLMARDVEDSTFTYSILIGPTNGTLTGIIPNLLYTPFPNVNGEDHFTYRTFDSELLSVDVQARVHLEPRPDAPVATSQSLTTPYNTPLAVDLSGYDVDGDPLSYTVITVPANGLLTGAAPNLNFKPNTSWTGSSSLTFRVNDGTSNSSPATVTLTVQAPTAVPAAPSGLTATAISSSQINLAWTDNAGWNEDGFKIERSGTGNSWTQIATVGPDVTSYSSSGLPANKNYSYRVRAYNVLGHSAYSGSASAKTLR